MIELPIADPDPRRRLETIQQTTLRLKEEKNALGMHWFTEMTGWAPAALLSLGARLSQRNLPFNMVVTNVPGPQQPLHLLTARMLDYYGLTLDEWMRSDVGHQVHPDDVDAAVLYADSLMNLTPWQLWTKDGKPADRYAALWVEKSGDDDAWMFVGITADEVTEVQEKLRDEKLISGTGAVESAHSATKVTGAKTGPARDPKTGRFIKKSDAKTTGVAGGPARDPKTGRFIKKSDAKTTGVAGGPARDPKTGRFIKKSDAKTTGVAGGPARDPKTGKFIKKSGTKTTGKKSDKKG